MALHYINATLNADKTLNFSQSAEINSGENLSTCLRFNIPTEFLDYNFNLEFLLPNQRKFFTGFIPLEATSDGAVLEYAPDRSLFSQRGRVYVQLCGRKNEDTGTVENFKSLMSADASFFVNPSIYDAQEPFLTKDALTEICETLDKAQKLLDGIQKDLQDGNLKGENGLTPNITLQTMSLASNMQPTVTKSGTAENPHFLLGIPKGEKGEQGQAGEKGDKGDTGAQGEKGDKGDTGEQGTQGPAGVTFTPSVSSSGYLSWTNNGGLANPSSVNIKGNTGTQGVGLVNVTPTAELEYDDMDTNDMVGTTLSIKVSNSSLRTGDIAIIPYYHSDACGMRIIGGQINSFDPFSGNLSVTVKWLLT